MSTSTSTRRVVKTILYVAEREDWQKWIPLKRIRPSTDKQIVLTELARYKAKRVRQGHLFSNGYRVVPYRQDVNGAVAV